LNEKFGTSYTLGQVKQKEQDLKKDYRRVKDLLEQSGFGWNSDRMMVEAPESIWASFATLKNNE
jgi:transposase